MRLDEAGDHVAKDVAHVMVVDRLGDLPTLPRRLHDPGGAQQAQVMRGQGPGEPEGLADLADALRLVEAGGTPSSRPSAACPTAAAWPVTSMHEHISMFWLVGMSCQHGLPDGHAPTLFGTGSYQAPFPPPQHLRAFR